MRKLLLASLLLCSGSVFAQGTGGYVTDSGGNPIRTGFNLCVKTGYWTASDTVVGCDGKEPTPVTVKPAPVAAQPQPVQPVLAESPVHFTIPANVLFGFDKYALTVDGKKALSSIITQHPVSAIHHVEVVGHTDRMGSEKYNQKLSERRAKAVADHFVAVGLAKDTVKANGRGESEPVTSKAECTGKKGNGLRACYAPDRRVEIKIHATKLQ